MNDADKVSAFAVRFHRRHGRWPIIKDCRGGLHWPVERIHAAAYETSILQPVVTGHETASSTSHLVIEVRCPEAYDEVVKPYRIDPDAGLIYGRRGKDKCISRIGYRGYIAVNSHGKPVGLAHRMIYEYVNGPIPDGLVINHKNGIKTDNRICNLEAVTPKENVHHAIRTGLWNPRTRKKTTA